MIWMRKKDSLHTKLLKGGKTVYQIQVEHRDRLLTSFMTAGVMHVLSAGNQSVLNIHGKWKAFIC